MCLQDQNSCKTYVGVELYIFICLVMAKDVRIRSVLNLKHATCLLTIVGMTCLYSLKLSYLGVLTANVSGYSKGTKLPHCVCSVSHINIHHITGIGGLTLQCVMALPNCPNGQPLLQTNWQSDDC